MNFLARLTKFARGRLIKAFFAGALSFSLAFAPFTQIDFAPRLQVAEADITGTNLNQPDLTAGVLGFALENAADIVNGTVPLYINKDPATGTFYISENVSGPTAFQRNPATGKHNIIAAGITDPYLQSLSTSLIGLGSMISGAISSLPISLLDAIRLLPKLGAIMDFAKNNPDIVNALRTGNIAGLSADQIATTATFLAQNPVIAQVGIKSLFGINLSQSDICTTCNFIASNSNLVAAARDYALANPSAFGISGGSLSGANASAIIDAIRPGSTLYQIAPSLNSLDRTTLFAVFDYGVANKATLGQIAVGNYSGVTTQFIQNSANLVVNNPSLGTAIANKNLIPGVPIDGTGVCTLCHIAATNPNLAKEVFDYGVTQGGFKNVPIGSGSLSVTTAQVNTFLKTLDTGGVYAPYVSALNTAASTPAGAAQVGNLIGFGIAHPNFFSGTPTAADIGAAAGTMLQNPIAGKGIVDTALNSYGLKINDAQYCATCNGVQTIATQYPNFTQATLAGLMAANPGTGGTGGVSQTAFDNALKTIAPGGAFYQYGPTLEAAATANPAAFSATVTFATSHVSGIQEIYNSGGDLTKISDQTLKDFGTFGAANPAAVDLAFSQMPPMYKLAAGALGVDSASVCATCNALASDPAATRDFLVGMQNLYTNAKGGPLDASAAETIAAQFQSSSPAAYADFVKGNPNLAVDTIAGTIGDVNKAIEGYAGIKDLTTFASDIYGSVANTISPLGTVQVTIPATYSIDTTSSELLITSQVDGSITRIPIAQEATAGACLATPDCTSGITLAQAQSIAQSSDAIDGIRVNGAATQLATAQVQEAANVNLNDSSKTYTIVQNPGAGGGLAVEINKTNGDGTNQQLIVPIDDPAITAKYGNLAGQPITAAQFQSIYNEYSGGGTTPVTPPPTTPGTPTTPVTSTGNGYYSFAPDGTLVLNNPSSSYSNSQVADLAAPTPFTETTVGGTGASISINGVSLPYDKTNGITNATGLTTSDTYGHNNITLQPGDKLYDSCPASSTHFCGTNYAIVHSDGTIDAYVGGQKLSNNSGVNYNSGTGGETVYSLTNPNGLPSGVSLPASLSTPTSLPQDAQVSLVSYDPTSKTDMANLHTALATDGAFQPVMGPDGKINLTVTQDGQRFELYTNCPTATCGENIYAVSPTTGQIVTYSSHGITGEASAVKPFSPDGETGQPGTYVLDPATQQPVKVLDTPLVLNQFEQVDSSHSVLSYVDGKTNTVSIISTDDTGAVVSSTPYSNASYNPVTNLILDNNTGTYLDNQGQAVTGTVNFNNSRLNITGSFDTSTNVTHFDSGAQVNGSGIVTTPEQLILPAGSTYNPVQNSANIPGLGSIDLSTANVDSGTGIAQYTTSKGIPVQVVNDNGNSVVEFTGKDGNYYRYENGTYYDSTDTPVSPSAFDGTGSLGGIGVTSPGTGGGTCSTCGGGGGGGGLTGLSLGDAAFNGLVGGLVGGIVGGIGALIGGAKPSDVLKGLAIGVAQGVLGAVLQSVLGGAGGGAGLGALTGVLGGAASKIPGLGAIGNSIPGLGGGQEVPVADKQVRQTTNSIFGNTQKLQDKEYILDPMAKSIAKIMIQKIAASMISWINHGFNGAPTFVTDPAQFFSDLGNTTANQFLQSPNGLGQTCSQYSNIVGQGLLSQFSGSITSFSGSFANGSSGSSSGCGLTGTMQSTQGYNSFVSGTSQFTWDQWNQLIMNNPINATVDQALKLNDTMAKQDYLAQKDLDYGRGYQSQKVCAVPDPNTKGACLQWTIQTPGSTIGDLAVQALSRTQFDSLIDANEINSIVNALSNQLMTKLFSFGDGSANGGGLLGLGSTSQAGSYAAKLAADQNAQGNTNVRRQTIAAINAAIRNFKNGKYAQDEKRAMTILDAGQNMINEVETCYQDKINGKGGVVLSPSDQAIAKNRVKEAQASIIGLINPARAQWNTQDAQNNSTLKQLLTIRTQLASANSAKDPAGVQTAINQYQALSDQLGLSANGVDSSVLDNLYTEVANLSTVIKQALKECQDFPPMATSTAATINAQG